LDATVAPVATVPAALDGALWVAFVAVADGEGSDVAVGDDVVVGSADELEAVVAEGEELDDDEADGVGVAEGEELDVGVGDGADVTEAVLTAP